MRKERDMQLGSGKPIETKPVTGISTVAVAGYIAWAILTFVPGVKTAIPPDLQGQLPVVIAAVLGALASYYAPHTPRPDLAPVETPAAPAEPQPVASGIGEYGAQQQAKP